MKAEVMTMKLVHTMMKTFKRGLRAAVEDFETL